MKTVSKKLWRTWLAKSMLNSTPEGCPSTKGYISHFAFQGVNWTKYNW